MSKNITKDSVLAGAVELIRQGKEVSARNIAKSLGCSTQPIYSLFSNMAELEKDLYYYIYKIHKNYIARYIGQNDMTPYKAYGMGFVAFAKEEKQLFKRMYEEKPFTSKTLDSDPYFIEVVDVICKTYGIDRERARKFHLSMSVFSYGLAVMQSADSNMSDGEISQLLTGEFDALAKIYF